MVETKKTIASYGFYDEGNIETQEQLINAIVRVSMMVATSYQDFYNKINNKILFIDDFIDALVIPCKEDMEGDYFLHNLLEAAKEIFNVLNYREVFYLCKERFNYFLEEENSQLVFTISDAFNLLEVNNNMLILPEKWFSDKIYKQIEEFLKTFECERIKYKKRVAYKNNGDFTLEQIINIGKSLNGVSLSTKFDFFPTPEELAQTVRDLAEIQDNDTILEPSAGTGSLLKGLNKNKIQCIEKNPILAEILKTKGFKVCNKAFEDVKSNTKFTRIIMNPPFSNRLDAQHILNAFNNYLDNNGILVAIHSTGIVKATDKNSKQFQELYKKYGVEQIKIPSGMFKNSGKGTNIETIVTKLRKVA